VRLLKVFSLLDRDCILAATGSLAALSLLVVCSGDIPAQGAYGMHQAQIVSAITSWQFGPTGRVILHANRCLAALDETMTARPTEHGASMPEAPLADTDRDATRRWLTLAIQLEKTSGLSPKKIHTIQKRAVSGSRELSIPQLAEKAENCRSEIVSVQSRLS
jgi:hypothetical protein